MKDEQLDDLKQFIDSRISQSEVRAEKKIDEKIDGLKEDMSQGFAAVGDAIEELNNSVDQRLTKLEEKAA